MPEDETQDRRKRNIAVERKIKDLTKDDVRVTVVGAIISVDKQSLLFNIEDPTGQLTVLAPTEESMTHLKVGGVTRVIGIVMPFDEGVELRAEVIQDFNQLSPELFTVLHECI